MKLQEAIFLFFKGNEPLNFSKITLVRSPKFCSERVTGHGSARLTPNGRIEITCNIDLPDSNRFVLGKEFKISSPIEGTFYTEEDYCSIEMMDVYGNLWHGDRIIIPEFEVFPLQFLTTIKFQMLHLRHTNTNCESAKALRLQCRTEFARNWNYLQNISVGIEVFSQHFNLTFGLVNDVVTILIASDSPIPKDFEFGILGALGFVFDESLDARLIERQEGEEYDISINGTNVIKSDSWPTIIFHPENAEYWNEFGGIIRMYIEKTFDTLRASNHKIHPLEYSQRFTRQPEYASLDGKILSACMVVDLIVELVSIETESKSKDVLDAKKETINFLRSSNFSDRTKTQIEQALQNVGSPSVKDSLYALAKSGNIIETDISAWNNLRNKYAHLRQKSLARQDNAVETYNKYLCVLRMIKHICFHYIGYRGSYTDYTSPGFPARKYPVVLSSEQLLT